MADLISIKLKDAGLDDQMARAFEPYHPVSVTRRHVQDQTVDELAIKFADPPPSEPSPGWGS